MLHRPIGGPEVLAGQLHHLAEAAALPAVTLQVLPTGTGARHPTASGFMILDFGELAEPGVGYVEHAFGSLLIEKESDVTAGRALFDRLRSAALSPTDPVALISRLAERIEAGGADGSPHRPVVHQQLQRDERR